MRALTDAELGLLLHDWHVIAEHDAGYVLGRCRVCSRVELLDLEAAPSSGAFPAYS